MKSNEHAQSSNAYEHFLQSFSSFKRLEVKIIDLRYYYFIGIFRNSNLIIQSISQLPNSSMDIKRMNDFSTMAKLSVTTS